MGAISKSLVVGDWCLSESGGLASSLTWSFLTRGQTAIVDSQYWSLGSGSSVLESPLDATPEGSAVRRNLSVVPMGYLAR